MLGQILTQLLTGVIRKAGSAECRAFRDSAARLPNPAKSRRLRKARSLHCKLVRSCFFGKFFGDPLTRSRLEGLPSPPRGRGQDFPLVWLRRRAALRYPFASLVVPGLIILAAATALRAQSLQGLDQRGIKALQTGQFSAAERIFASLVKLDPTASNLAYLATAEAACGDYGQAIAHFRKSIGMGNDSPSLRYNLALAYLKDRQPENGIRELRVVLASDPNDAAARLALGVALLDEGEPREALKDIEAVKAPLAKNPWMWTYLVRAEFRAGDAKSALRTIDESLGALSDDPQLRVVLAESCVNHRQLQKARELLENALESAPDDPALKVLLAGICLRAEEPEETLAVLRGLPASAGKPGQVPFMQGSALLLLGKTKEAEPLLAAAMTAAPRNADYLSRYAELEIFKQDYAGAIASLEKARALQPASAGLPYRMAVIYIFMHRYDAAVASCQQALRLAPDSAQAYFLLGAIEFAMNESKAAEAAFRQAMAINPGSALYHSALGAAIFKAGLPAEGAKELDDALKLNPRTVSAYYWRANVYIQEKQDAKAIADLETFVALDGNYSEAYKQLAQLYAAEGDAAKASALQAHYVALKQKAGQSSVPFFWLSQFGLTRLRQVRSGN
jgi:predicted Zn-dependent protease